MSVRVLLAAQAHALLYRSSRRVASRVCSHSDAACPVKSTQKWIRDVVVGLNLCPGRARRSSTVISASSNPPEDAFDCARREFDAVAATENATVAIAISDACAFEDYLDLVDAVDDAIDAAGHRGAIQLATFHPEYQFGDAAPDAASHWTNRSALPRAPPAARGRRRAGLGVEGRPRRLEAERRGRRGARSCRHGAAGPGLPNMISG